MYISDKVSITPIGCSCINRFQIDFNTTDKYRKTGIFDWLGASPATTISVLEAIQNNTFMSIISNRDNYIVYDSKYGKIPINTAFEALLLWHEDISDFDLFVNKMQHLLNNFMLTGENAFFLWSNIQPNLELMFDAVGIDTSLLYLRYEHYLKINKLIKDIFNGDVIYISRLEDCDPKLHDVVHMLEINKSDEYKGPKDLYSNILKNIIF